MTSPFAVIFGHLALPQIERAQGTEKGREMAIGGLALGYLFIVFWLVMLVIAVVAGDDSSTNR